MRDEQVGIEVVFAIAGKRSVNETYLVLRGNQATHPFSWQPFVYLFPGVAIIGRAPNCPPLGASVNDTGQ